MSPLEVLECAHLKPGDRLVVRIKDATEEQVLRWRQYLDSAGWNRDQVLIVSGVEEMVVVEANPAPGDDRDVTQ